MKKGQMAPRLLMLLFSWLMLIVALALMFFFQALDKDDSVVLPGAVNSPNIEATLSGFLRQSVDLGGDKVPMAELLALAAMSGQTELIAQKSEDFVSNIQGKKELIITLPGDKKLPYGDKVSPVGNIITRTTASAQLPLPDGKMMTVTYSELEVTAVRRTYR